MSGGDETMEGDDYMENQTLQANQAAPRRRAFVASKVPSAFVNSLV